MKNKIRFYLGLISYVMAWILPLSGFLVARLNLSPGVKAAGIGLPSVAKEDMRKQNADEAKPRKRRHARKKRHRKHRED